MQDIIIYLIIVAIGYLVGTQLRKRNVTSLKWVGPFQSVATCFILFVMGTRIGSNQEVIDNLPSIGLKAVIITLFIMCSTVLSIFIARKLLRFDSFGNRDTRNSFVTEAPEESTPDNKDGRQGSKSSFDYMTFLIVGFVILGMASGYFFASKLFPDYDSFSHLASSLIRIGLSILLFFVGLDLGMSGTAMKNFRSAGLSILFFPLATVIGTMLGGIAVSFLINLSIKEGLAVASGFGWYSLAPAIIIDAGHIELSAISFIHNVMRELLSIIAIPFIARYIGYIEASGVSGAPAMDICLPVVERSTNSTIAIYAFIIGVITSFIVPILVPLFV